MHRRDFLSRAAAAASALTIAGPRSAFAADQATPSAPAQPATQPPPAGPRAKAVKHTFKLKYAPHFGMFRNSAGEDLSDQLRWMADSGFTAFEDNGMMRRTPEVQQQLGDLMAKVGITMGVFVVDTGGNNNSMFTPNKPENRELFAKACTAAVDVAKRVNAKWMTVVPGNFERRLPIGIQTGNVIDVLRTGADVLAKHNLTMVLEPLSDTPDLFLRTADQTYEICRAVNSPACKILYDMYHMQRNTGNIIPMMDWCWDEIGYMQIGDNPGRKEPTSGEMNYKVIFKHIYDKARETKREFVLGMEHGNAYPGTDGEQKLIEAYVQSDNF
jgi:hydroxypyruvate isomerase